MSMVTDLEIMEVAEWLKPVKEEILKDARRLVKAIENLKTCNSSFKPVDGNPMHLRRER